MDLDDFDRDVEVRPVSTSDKNYSAKAALDYIDGQWYTTATRAARWMDLIGDYAGNELFLIDGACLLSSRSSLIDAVEVPGEALLREVLDDPLLAIGRDGGTRHQQPIWFLASTDS